MKTAVMGATAVVMAASVLLAQPVQRAAEIRRPAAGDILTGAVVLEVEVPATAESVRDIVFQVDGTEVCRVLARPFRCNWNAGSLVSPRIVRVVVTWDDGERTIRTVRTTGVNVQESSRVDSVIVSAHVADNRGRFVAGLTAADFKVVEDGVPQELTFVGAEQVPSQVLLALDISGSMGDSMSTLRQAARGFMAALRGSDSVSVTAFNTGLFVLAPWGATAATRDAALERLRPWGSTAVYDSIIRAADVLKSREGRRVLVLFTDGDDVASRGSAESARVALQTHDVVLYMIAQGKAESDRAVREELTALAEGTGGRAMFASRVGALVDQFSAVVEDLSKLYVLAYSPKRPLGDGKWRSVEVEPVNRRLRVRARQGYFATVRSAGGEP